MRFDVDLTYRILTTIEDLPPSGSISVNDFIDEEKFPDEGERYTPYDNEFIRVSYHMELLVNSGLLEAYPFHAVGIPATNYTVRPGLNNASGLTLDGHQYLAMLRDDTILNRLKKKVKSGLWSAAEALSIEAVKLLIF